MKKRICCLLCLLAVFGWLVCPACTWALTPLETERPCSLQLQYTREGIGIGELETRIYRVAEANADGTFRLVSPFSGYPVNIYGITSQTEWKTVATTLSAYVTADGVQPDHTAITDESGNAVFSDLKTGLYLVSGVTATHESGIYVFDAFMVYLPTPQEDGSYAYDVVAKPKCSAYTPATEYKVVKLWKDAGIVQNRPASVTVEILKDGLLHETIVLSPENNWTYSWKDPGGESVWMVTEQDVPDAYTVTLQIQESTFLITNTNALPGDNPNTGDTSTPWVYVVSLCLSGFALLILGIGGRRGRKDG